MYRLAHKDRPLVWVVVLSCNEGCIVDNSCRRMQPRNRHGAGQTSSGYSGQYAAFTLLHVVGALERGKALGRVGVSCRPCLRLRQQWLIVVENFASHSGAQPDDYRKNSQNEEPGHDPFGSIKTFGKVLIGFA